jgi:surface antigen
MPSVKTVVALGLAGVMLAGCQSGPKQGVGQVAGGVTGALIGSQFGSGSGKLAATALGAVIGTMIGGEIGRRLDEADQRALYDAQYRALEYGNPGAPVGWKNASSGHYGEVVPGQGYKVNAHDCRDYTHTIYIGGQPEVARGTACRQPDGTWKPIS